MFFLSFFLSFYGILQCIANLNLHIQIQDEIINQQSVNKRLNKVSLYTIAGNLIWNIFCFFTTFFISLNYKEYFYDFLIPSIIYLANSDLVMFYTLWSKQYLYNLSEGKEIIKKILVFILILGVICN